MIYMRQKNIYMKFDKKNLKKNDIYKYIIYYELFYKRINNI